MNIRRYQDFDLAFSGMGNAYWAHVVHSPAGEAEAAFSLPFQRNELDDLLRTIGLRRQVTRAVRSSALEAAQELGSRLFEAIFKEEILTCYRSSLETVRLSEATGLRLKLRFGKNWVEKGTADPGRTPPGQPDLPDLPWELMYDRAFDRFLAQSVQTPVIRYLEIPQRIAPLAVQLPLRILVAFSRPAGYPPIDIEKEQRSFQMAVQPLQDQGAVQVEWLQGASLSSLQHALRQGGFHIFHFIGHGGFDPQTQESVLVLENSARNGALVDAQRMGVMLHDSEGTLRLAVLNACEGARSSPRDPFAGVATNLVRQGIPAVVAMQFEISDTAAILFAQEFYTAIAQGYPVDAAVVEARKAIYFQPNDIEWATPVLFMRSPDGVLFELDRDLLTMPRGYPGNAGAEKSRRRPPAKEPGPGRVGKLTDLPQNERLRGHTGTITGLAFSPDGVLLASSSRDKTVRLWHTADGRPLAVLIGHHGAVNAVSFSPNGVHLASAAEDGQVILWRIADRAVLRVIRGHAGSVKCVIFSPDGALLATGSLDCTIRIWRSTDGRLVRSLPAAEVVNELAFTPDGQLIAAACGWEARHEQVVQVWRVRDGKSLHRLHGHAYRLNSLCFSPDGKYLATGSATAGGGSPAASGKEIRLWRLHHNRSSGMGWQGCDVNSLAFHPNSQTLISGLGDHTVRLWQVPEGRLLNTLRGHSGGVTSVAASPDGFTLASGSEGDTIRIWRV